jgi:hypothetical protein
MVVGYLGSAAFAGLAPTSKEQYRQNFERMRRDYGEMDISTLKRKHVMRMLDAKAETPSSARDFLKCLRLIIRFATSESGRTTRPAASA